MMHATCSQIGENMFVYVGGRGVRVTKRQVVKNSGFFEYGDFKIFSQIQ